MQNGKAPRTTPTLPMQSYGGVEEVAPGVARLGIAFVNAYFVEGPGEAWVLVDTGLPGAAPYVRRAAEQRFGGRAPEAIALTHGHFDHAGSAQKLADAWDVPIYAHEAELPYLTGRSDYPPKDPTMGGAIAFLARFFPDSGYDFGDRVQALPEDGSVPGLGEDWRWIHTPGHTPGHVSFYRREDGLLLAGDAFCTMDLDSWAAQVTQRREISRPPSPFTPDWEAARRSVERLADLSPEMVAAGHGLPITEGDVAAALHHFARHFRPPAHGRYVGHPIRADEDEGVTHVPPPAPDPLPKQILGGALAAFLAGVGILGLARWRRGQ